MKLVIVVPDGMADRPDEFEDGRTPLELARTPVMDELARGGEVGTVVTVPEDVAPGSDAACMAVLGVQPGVRRIGRAAIEAAGRGVELGDDDVVFRANLVTIRDGVMEDYSGGGLAGGEAKPFVEALAPALRELGAELHVGVGYRVLKDTSMELEDLVCTPPHDITERPTAEHLPRGPGAERVLDLMKRAKGILASHPENAKRTGEGKRPANSIWLWGQGRRAELPQLKGRLGVTGAVISAVDLVRGLGRAMGMDVIEVEGVTGDLDTNFAGKGEAAARALDDHDVVFVHVEAPDEAGHHGDAAGKRSAIEAVDREVLARVHGKAKERGDTRILVLPDHLTPLSIRTHAHGEVPFVLWGPGIEPRPAPAFTEREAAKTGVHVERGWELLGRALGTN